MNAERLRELVDELIADDRRFGFQKKTQQLSDALQQLAENPQNTEIQGQVVQFLNALDKSIEDFSSEITPATKEVLETIGATEFFSAQLVSELREQLRSNALTAAVPAQSFAVKRDQRIKYLEILRGLSSNLDHIGIYPPEANPGTAELGILIPRGLFHNELDPLSKELHTLHKIIAIFSESATGKPPTIAVKQISTSDPTFVLGLDVITVGAIAGSITWLLNTLKQALEIKSIWQKSKQIGFTDKELKVFEDKADKYISSSIAERVKELTANKEDARSKELQNGLDWAHRAILARIERGMTVEVRFLPPPPPEPTEDGEGEEAATKEYEAKAAPFNELARLAPLLDFPVPVGEPLIKLPSAEPPKTDS